MARGFSKGIGIKSFLAKVFTDKFVSGLLISSKIIQFITVAYNGLPAVLEKCFDLCKILKND